MSYDEQPVGAADAAPAPLHRRVVRQTELRRKKNDPDKTDCAA